MSAPTVADVACYRPPAPEPERPDPDKGRRIAVVVRRALLMLVKTIEDEYDLAPREPRDKRRAA